MSTRYKRTFDAVQLSSERQKQLRQTLASLSHTNQSEKKRAHRLTYKNNRALIVAVAAILALTLAGFTFGKQIIRLLGGGQIEFGTNSSGVSYIAMDTGFDSDPVLVQDGQIYFVLDGSEQDITNQCSQVSYFQYEYLADGYRHVVIIGGTPDAVGWAEFVWTESGDIVGSNATYTAEHEPVWLKNAQTALNQL